VHGSVGALAVIRSQVADVASRLVDIRPICVAATLELQDQHSSTHQQHDVRTAELERKLVLQDGGVVRGERVLDEDLADLALKRRDGLIPRPDLFSRDFPEEVLERAPDLDRGRGPELGEC
jgi:hypothetical protein